MLWSIFSINKADPNAKDITCREGTRKKSGGGCEGIVILTLFIFLQDWKKTGNKTGVNVVIGKSVMKYTNPIIAPIDENYSRR